MGERRRQNDLRQNDAKGRKAWIPGETWLERRDEALNSIGNYDFNLVSLNLGFNITMLIQRRIIEQVQRGLGRQAAVVLIGPRQVGNQFHPYLS